MESKQYEKGVLENRRAAFNLFSLMFGFPEPPTSWTLGVDTSHWNGLCNFALMKSKGIKFGVTKATDVGWGSKLGFVDSKAIYNYTEMGKQGFLRGGYHWLDPKYGSGEYQANYYLENFYFKYPTELPPVMDFEDNDIITPTDMLARAKEWLETVEKATNRIPIVYTSNGYMSKFPKEQTGFLARYPLWVAHYIQRAYPSIPAPWTKAVNWQYSDKGDFPYYKWGSSTSYGREWGSGSHSLDMNWWMGTYMDLLAFCEGVEEPPVEPSGVLFQARCIVSSLFKRTGPSTSFPTAGHLTNGQVVDVYEEKNGWFRISENIWCSGHSSYMQKISEPITPPVIEPPTTEPLKKLYYPCDERWRISQYFGERPWQYTQAKGHNGIDFAIPVGNPLYAAWDGTVEVAEAIKTGYGRHIRIRHSHGVTIYGHMRRIDVGVGDKVKAKQVIGLSGGATSDPYSGMSTGPHLHFEYRWDIPAPQVPGGYKYNAVDPLPLLISHEPDGEPLYKIEVVVSALNVRSGAGVGFPVLYTIKLGQRFDVYEEKDNWVRIGNGKWCSGYPAYIKKL